MKKEEEDKNSEFSLNGCFRYKEDIYIPFDEVIRLLQRFSCCLGKDLAKALLSSSASIKIPNLRDTVNEDNIKID